MAKIRINTDQIEQQRRLAFHEAGHAVLGRVLGLPCGGATIIAAEEHELGHAVIDDPIRTWGRGDGPRRPLIEASCVCLYAGAEAERALLNVIDEFHDGPDCSKATSLISIIGVRGARFVGDEVWERYEAKLRRRANQMVRSHASTVERLAELLLKIEAVSGSQIDALMDN